MNLLILLAVGAAVAYRVIAPADRARYLATALASLRELRSAIVTPRPDYVSFTAALQQRTPRAVIAPALIALNVTAVLGVLGGSGSFSDAALIRWGANLGIKTTNGEWWRLVTSAFLHAGLIQLIVAVVVLMQLGAMVERLAGRAALAAAYVSAAAAAGLRHVATRPIAVATSASPAICGIYGLFAACVLWQIVRRSSSRPAAADDESPDAPDPRVIVPLIAIKRIAVVGIVFFVVSMADATTTVSAEFFGFLAGAAYGVALGFAVTERSVGGRAVGAAFATCTVATALCAWPLRNIADVKPALEAVIATEARTAAAFQDAFERFSRQRLSADALAEVAERKIVPELQAADARLDALRNVPAEHQMLVADARAFLTLRSASWRARADALRRTHSNLRAAADGGRGDAGWRVQAERRFRSSMAAAGKAEAAERAASDAFERLRYSWRPIAE